MNLQKNTYLEQIIKQKSKIPGSNKYTNRISDFKDPKSLKESF